MISPSDSMGFDLQPVSFNPANGQGFGALIYIPIMLIVCVVFSSLALGLNWMNIEVEYDFEDPNEDDLYGEIDDSLSERETYLKMGSETQRTTDSNDDLEDKGYEDTVSQKITLKVITIIMIVFTGIAVLLSFAAFMNIIPIVKIMTAVVWVIAILSIAQIVIFAAFYDPFAGTAVDEEDSGDIECGDEELSGFLNIHAEGTTDCTIRGEDAEVTVSMYAGVAFWFAFVQMILILISGIFSIIHMRKLGSQGFSDVKVFQTY